MLLIEYREHCQGEYRVWTEEDAAYGSFKILTFSQLRMVIRACTLMGGLCRPAKDANIRQVDMSSYYPEHLDTQTAIREQLGSM